MKTLVILVLGALVAGCGGSVSSIYEQYPWLRPGETTAEAVLAAPGERELRPLSGLDAMVDELLERSPTVRGARLQWRAAVERVPAASALPDPQLQYTWLPVPVETRTGPNEHRFQLTQMIPFPSKLVAKDAAARAMAGRAAVAFDAAVRDAVTRLKVAYADLYYTERALLVIEQNQELARAISELGATRSAEGKGLLFDVARAQSQLGQLTYDRVTLTERRDVARAQVNAALGRPADAPVHAAESLPALSVDVPEQELLARAIESQQELRMIDQDIRAAEANLDLAGSQWAPDLMVGGMLLLQGPSKMMPVPPDSGEEAVGIMFGISLPIWFHAYAAGVSEAEARLASTVWAKKAHLDGLQARMAEALYAVRNAERLRVLYDEQLLPHAIAALGNAEQASKADPSRYADLLESRAVYYSFALARERAVADQFQAVARLEQLIGATLAPEGGR